MKFTQTVDMDKLRVFYDPHPGFAGAAVPIPQKIKQVADALSGQTMSLREAVKRLRATQVGLIEVVPDRNFIRLSLTDPTGRYVAHIFCAIKYR